MEKWVLSQKRDNHSDSEAEFKEFELRLKFKTPLKYGWFRLNCIQCFKI